MIAHLDIEFLDQTGLRYIISIACVENPGDRKFLNSITLVFREKEYEKNDLETILDFLNENSVTSLLMTPFDFSYIQNRLSKHGLAFSKKIFIKEIKHKHL